MSGAATPNDAELPLAELVDELARRFQVGEALDLEAYLAQHPEHAHELRELLPALALLADLGRAAEPGEVSQGEAAREVEPPWGRPRGPRVLGDFRIQREIGRGGMGIVYEAEQLSLRRRVALKVLPLAAILDPRRLQRFKNEALAAASLDHPNIVQVYSVGCDRGVHYFAMEYIAGQTLAEVISQLRQRWNPADAQGEGPEVLPSTLTWLVSAGVAGATSAEESQRGGPARPAPRETLRPTAVSVKEETQRRPEAHISTKGQRERAEWFRLAASLGIQAAEALEHAHRVGVVHRDIKPSNLLVNVEGHLWVTDFGLAATQVGSNVTVTGDVVGTLRYMSPEQVTGCRRILDHHTDIYSLGVTLYELLTLEPAFPETDRQRLARAIVEEEPIPPRRIQAAIPRDLETVVLKAMAKEPEARYATAADFAADLKRFLEDKPIEARRLSQGERLAKWARRHRPLVRLAAAFFVMMLLGLMAATTVIWKKGTEAAAALALANDRGQRLELALAAEENARQLAEQRRKEAEAARKRAWLAVAESLRGTQTVASVADVLVASGGWAEAEALYRQLVSLWEHLSKAPAGDIPVDGQALGEAYRPLAELLQASGRFREGEMIYRQGVALYQQLAADEPRLAFLFLWEAAEMQRGLADLLTEAGELPEAATAYRAALATLGAIAPDQPFPHWNANLRAEIFEGLGNVSWASGQTGEAKQQYRQALALREEEARALPKEREPARALAAMLADCPAEDLRDPWLAVWLARKAAQTSPPSREPRRYGWMPWHTLGVACYRAGQYDDAIDALSKSLAMHSFRDSAGRLFLAMAHQRSGNTGEARRLYDEAQAWIETHKPRDPGLRRLREEAKTVLGLGRQEPND